MRILLAEDDRPIAHVIRRGLGAAGYEVDVAEDGDSAFAGALAGDYDLLILDLMLPRRDGWSICEELRRRGKSHAVLMLTARDGVQDRLRGFQAGADDYLPKPFHFAELLARVEALARRAPVAA